MFVAKENRICDVCKREYTPASYRQRYCNDCRKIGDRMRERERYERNHKRGNKEQQAEKPDMSWAEIVRICNAHGLSYGQAWEKGLLNAKEEG